MQNIYQVSDLTLEVRQLLEASYPSIWVEGEISNLAKPASGHLYFSLKDDKSQIRCALFRNRSRNLTCTPKDGMQVRVRAQVSLYENRGDFQLIISHLEEAGLGNLQIAFEKLKQKLSAEGLFDNEHKKPLPDFPKTIGVITSASGAVIKDITTTCERRYPLAKILLYPVQVQGEQAAKEISAAIIKADQSKLCDVLIVGRGGGSIEDLWAFNQENLARTIFTCQTPVISAVGHDVDFTISDFVADVRAPTPTAAAELATPDMSQLLAQFKQSEKRLFTLISSILNRQIQHVDILTRRLVDPAAKLKSWQQSNSQLSERLQINIRTTLSRQLQVLNHINRLIQTHSPEKKLSQAEEKIRLLKLQLIKSTRLSFKYHSEHLQVITGKLVTLSPQSTLDRGYAIVSDTDNHQILRKLKDVKADQQLNIQLADGAFAAKTEN